MGRIAEVQDPSHQISRKRAEGNRHKIFFSCHWNHYRFGVVFELSLISELHARLVERTPSRDQDVYFKGCSVLYVIKAGSSAKSLSNCVFTVVEVITKRR